MNLLDKLEKKTIIHPMYDFDFIDKSNYLKALAFFIHIDDVILEEEKYIFNEIIESLQCEDMKDDLFDFLKDPLVEEYDEIFSLFSNKEIMYSYLTDCIVLSYDVNRNGFDDFEFNSKETIFIKNTFEELPIDSGLNFILQKENKFFISMVRRKTSFCKNLFIEEQLEKKKKKEIENKKIEQKKLEIKKRKVLEEEQKKALKEEQESLEYEEIKHKELEADKRILLEKEKKDEEEKRDGIIGLIMFIIIGTGYYFYSWKGLGISFIIITIVYTFLEKYIKNDSEDDKNE